MSTVQPTDKTLVNRAGVDYSAPADMSTVQDTDLLLINRAGVDYKCTFLDWKNSQSKAPDVGTVILADDAPGGNRFTSQTFTSTVTMTEDGDPASTKGIKAWVEGTLKSAAQSSAITKVTTSTKTVPVPLAPTIRALVGTLEAGRGVERAFDNDMRTGCNTDSGSGVREKLQIDFGHDVPISSLRICGQTQGSQDFNLTFNNDPGSQRTVPSGLPSYTFQSIPGTIPAIVRTIELESLQTGMGYCGIYIFAIEVNGVWLQSATSVSIPTTVVTLEFASAAGLSGFASDDKVTEVGGGADATGAVSSVNGTTTPPTMDLLGVTGTWDVGSSVKGPLKPSATSVKMFTKLDASLNVTDLQSADPGYTAFTGLTPRLTFPALMPSGQAPDLDLPAGTTLQTEVKATNTRGSDTAQSAKLTPA